MYIYIYIYIYVCHVVGNVIYNCSYTSLLVCCAKAEMVVFRIAASGVVTVAFPTLTLTLSGITHCAGVSTFVTQQSV